MTRYRVVPYRAGSRGATELATALGGRCLRLAGSTFTPRGNDVLVNWGNTDPPRLGGARWFNGEGIRDASNKLSFFNAVTRNGQSEIIPSFWTRREEIPADAYPIVCRTVLAGHSGEGIVIADSPDQLVHAPLYVRYVKKQDEYRVHVGRRSVRVRNNAGEQPGAEIREESIIIDIQQKRRRHDHAEPDFRVRNLANGFIYAREGIDPPVCVSDVAKLALGCTSLDFGAVDVVYNARENRAYVLEINTAPGITGTTVERYRNFFQDA